MKCGRPRPWHASRAAATAEGEQHTRSESGPPGSVQSRRVTPTGSKPCIASAQERNGAVDAPAHGDGNAPLAGGRGRGRAEGVVQGLGSQPRGRHGCSFEDRESSDRSAELSDSLPLARSVLHAAAKQRQANPGQVASEGRVPDHVHAVNVAKEVRAPPRR